MKIEIPSNIDPVPPEEIVRRLRSVNPALGVRFVHSNVTPYWALTWDWPMNDPRRVGILKGTQDPKMAWDMIAMLPLDCSVDQAYSYFVNNCRRSDKKEIRALLDRVSSYNSERNTEIWAPTMDAAEAEIDRLGSSLFRLSKSFGGLPGKGATA